MVRTGYLSTSVSEDLGRDAYFSSMWTHRRISRGSYIVQPWQIRRALTVDDYRASDLVFTSSRFRSLNAERAEFKGTQHECVLARRQLSPRAQVLF